MAADQYDIDRIVEFHGHLCPGLAMGVLAARIALDEIGPHAADEEVVAVAETDMCAVDAVQFMTGCTFGKGNLVHHDWGKNAFTFYRRSDGKAIRVAARPGAIERDPEQTELLDRIRSGEAGEEEQQRLQELRLARSRRVLEMEPADVYAVKRFVGTPPPKARIHATLMCDRCGEGVMETRIRHHDGQQLCVPCYEAGTADR